MTSKIAILSIVTLIAVFQRADASYIARTSTRDGPSVVLKISDLRSAYLLRAGVVRYDELNRTPGGLRQELQRHFDVVLSLLTLATPDSIETALLRLQAADDHSWSASERTAWRRKLLAARLVQLQRLAAYRDRGIFPLNEGQSEHPVPIFVDRHGTACAVGHLMRCSGWSEVVDSIQQSNDLVYVPDAAHSAIASWVRTSGITLEEAALIQPGYNWTPGQFDASAYEPGESTLENSGLRYSNFQLQAQNYLEPSGITTVGATATIAGLGLSAGKGTYVGQYGGFPTHTPIGTHWIAIGGTDASVQSPLHSLKASAASGRGQLVLVSFDVAAIDSNQRINGISESSYPYWQGFHNLNFSDVPPAGAVYYLKTNALDGATNLASLNIDQSTTKSFISQESSTQSFAARQQISVTTSLWLRDGAVMDTYLLDFNIVTVPEPTSGFLATTVMATCGAAINRKGRK